MQSTRFHLGSRLFLGCALSALSVWTLVAHAQAVAADSGERIIVKWKSELDSDQAQDSARLAVSRQISAAGGARLRQVRRMDGGMEVVRIDAAGEDSLRKTLETLRADAAVEYAVPDRRRRAHALPDDPLFNGQWYLQDTEPAATHATTAWNTTQGSSAVIVAVLDTGVRFEHPDLQGKLLAGYDFVGSDSEGVFLTANDGDGRDADASDPGDWINAADRQTAQFSRCPVEDSSWHGTRVSGIIAAATDNAVGVAGLGWNTRILPVRVLGKCGGYDSDIIDAMRWAAGIRVRGVPVNPNPAQIVNLSLGGIGRCSAAYAEVIGELMARGVLIVASAGNAGGPVEEPANCAGVLGVAGLRQSGTKVGYSSLGPEIGISAPAGNCVNPSGACVFSLNTTTNRGVTSPTTSGYTDQFITNIGTSFSAPMVAGAAALMRAVNPSLTVTQLIARLQSSATPFPSQSADTGVTAQCHPEPQGSTEVQNAECVCTTGTCGVGMVNAAGAVDESLRPTAVIQAMAVAANGRTETLTGTGSSAAEGHSIVHYSWNTDSASSIVSTDATAVVNIPLARTVIASLTVTDDAGRTDRASVTLSASAVNAIPLSPHAGGGGGMGVCFLLALLSLGVLSRLSRQRDAMSAESPVTRDMISDSRSFFMKSRLS